MPWLYNKDTGDVLHQNEAEWLADKLVPGQADIDLGIPDSDTQAQAVAAAQKYATAHNTTPPTTSSSTANSNAEKTVASKSGTLGSALGFLNGLTSANLWIRVAKVTIGGVILIVGLAKLTGADKSVGGAVATAVKAAPLL